jgi:hypothetical protein
MASTWTEYLRLSVIGDGAALLEMCMYEALAEAPDWDEGDEERALAEEIDGKTVVGIDDDWIIGGELCCIDDDKRLTFDKSDIEGALRWLTDNGWEITSGQKDELCNAVGGGDCQMSKQSQQNRRQQQ